MFNSINAGPEPYKKTITNFLLMVFINTTFVHDYQSLGFNNGYQHYLHPLYIKEFQNKFSHIMWEIPIIHESSQFQNSHNAGFFPYYVIRSYWLNLTPCVEADN